MPSAHKVEVLIRSLSGKHLGFVVIGIPEDQFLELKAKFPEKGFSGQDPRVNEAIEESVTEEERERIAIHLKQPHNTKLRFELFGGILHVVDEAKENPAFESNGKKFWVKPKQNYRNLPMKPVIYLYVVVAIIAAALVDLAGMFITKQFGDSGSAADPITLAVAAIVLVSIIGYGLLKSR